ncbi:hypothetical protein [uncultured Sunxiuqinia sp.]|uniref:hypothetical protein n=1 Tax=uncultured Sunxiuqinia sp. TaxID=1573825 RepID=UPI002AA87E8F|nr:hypothetical protein [uncultured Sunxiuqinia sp.]
MKKILILIFVGVFFILEGCSKYKDCGACFTPPEFFRFELVDKYTGVNLFTNETFNQDEIEILDSSNSSVEFNFVSENNINVIEIYTIGWQTEIVNYRVNISSENIFDLYVDAERLSEDCCSFTRFNEIEISNAEFTWNSRNDAYRILVD